ncbi:hypothetical protein [Exiguobacterium sp. BMC-KP]|uniref:hypothetical protein n=1 Tax=Exiguobacterium sp. BMC-KP TaxID=1684312 RepID=UPI000AC2ECB6|nr:hypothetical protein [Exiguobacterium sp. BMC-KP]
MSLLDKLLQDLIVSDLPRLHTALLAKDRGLRKVWLVHMDRFNEEANTWNFGRL